MKKLALTILLVAAVAATWAQKPDKKTARLQGDCGEEKMIFL